VLSATAYPDLTSKNISSEEVFQWNGKEIQEMSRYLLGVVTQSLRGGSHTQGLIITRAIECTQALLVLYMYAQYITHNDVTLSYMEDAMRRFPNCNNDLLLERAAEKAKTKTNALITELVNKRKKDEDTHAETWMPPK
jgi:hypothetical protein